ncbi:transcription antitermination factor NusB [Candidatus Palauibacter sp.]|uniref:transcription antitermination factor NusB n=1 Tax=Candidatus Palauibacter sp. TaxID=3101350 RepID=UPI003B5CAC9E
MNPPLRSHVRSRSRSWTLNLLYAWEVAGEGTPLEHARRILAHRRMSARYRPHVERLLETVSGNLPEIDAAIGRHASNWRLERLHVIDRNILRIGIAELRWLDDVPPRVTIHEALKLATRYGSPESPRFLNGVLDAVLKAGEGEP